jgi:hypothetical protein
MERLNRNVRSLDAALQTRPEVASSLFGVGNGRGVMNREAARKPPSTPALARRSGLR